MSGGRSNAPQLTVAVNVGGLLLGEGRMDLLQRFLTEHAPRWAAGLRVQQDGRTTVPVDVAVPGALSRAVHSVATRRGPLYYKLIEELGAPATPRLTGFAELRGSAPSLTVVVTIDEDVFRRTGERWWWGNTVTMQVRGNRIDGVDSIPWSVHALRALCSVLSSPYSYAAADDEYDAKNIDRAGGGMAAIGVDVAKALPGLYWLNFFGRPYRDLIGRGRLLSAPAHEVLEVDDGVLLMLNPNPRAWNTSDYRATEQGVLRHLGAEHFFSREDPGRLTVAPDFNLPSPPRSSV